MNLPSIVTVDAVSKRFVLNKHKSLKERIVNAASQQRHVNDFWALRDIDLDIKAGTTVGLVGHNGSGKSTLLKVIGGIVEPSSGTVRRRGRMAALLELGAGFHPDLSGRENVYLNASILGFSRRETDQQFDSIVDFSGIEHFIDTQVKFFSSGMYVRLAFAVAVHVDPDLLLVDEVLAVGDEPFQNKCIAKIAEFQKEGRTIIVVSHSAAQVEALCDRVAVLDHGRLIFEGPPKEGIDLLQQGYEQQAAQEQLSTAVEQSPAAVVTGVALSAGRTPPIHVLQLQAGDDLSVDLTYEVEREEDHLIAGITLETARGVALYAVTTEMLGKIIPQGVGEHLVNFAISKPSLGAGDFSIRGSLETVRGDTVSVLKSPSTLTVVPSRPGAGALSLEVSARISSVPRGESSA